MTIVYKVFHVGEDGTLESAWVYSTEHNHTYRVGDVTLPRVGRLAAFEDLEAAMAWIIQGEEIWECDGEDPITLFRIPNTCLVNYPIQTFWDHVKDHQYG